MQGRFGVTIYTYILQWLEIHNKLNYTRQYTIENPCLTLITYLELIIIFKKKPKACVLLRGLLWCDKLWRNRCYLGQPLLSSPMKLRESLFHGDFLYFLTIKGLQRAALIPARSHQQSSEFLMFLDLDARFCNQPSLATSFWDVFEKFIRSETKTFLMSIQWTSIFSARLFIIEFAPCAQ